MSRITELEAELAKAKLSNAGMHKTIERLTDRIAELEEQLKETEYELTMHLESEGLIEAVDKETAWEKTEKFVQYWKEKAND